MSESDMPRMTREFSDMIKDKRMNWEMIAFAMKDKAVELDSLLKSAVNETWNLGTKSEELQAELTAARAEIDKWEQIACDKLSEVCGQIEKTRLVTEQRDEARRLAERYRNLSCEDQDEADETLLPWETTNQNEL